MEFDKDKAKEILGKYILIGITYLDSSGELESQQQLHGIVKSATEDEGILIELEGNYKGDEWNMPPDTSCITTAEPGEYKLRSTDEVVVNPDYLCTWKVHSPDEENET
ncbi:MAG: hypothetical protein DRR19_28795 [Candidatus Parabeggiatoa sp. nov. 1]|nr:MAG: hypothetical protein DRR19_28795 [Gammaproteobacteria bacterium]